MKGLTALCSVPNMFCYKMFGILQSQLLFGRMSLDMFGVENAYYYIKLSGSELIDQRRLVLRR